MLIARSLLIAMLALALGVYLIDCLEMGTPDDAMKCCDSMPCRSHDHDNAQDCCKMMTSTHTAFVQPSMYQFSFSTAAVALPPVSQSAAGIAFFTGIVAVHCHAPPISQEVQISPLRI